MGVCLRRFGLGEPVSARLSFREAGTYYQGLFRGRPGAGLSLGVAGFGVVVYNGREVSRIGR